MKMTEFCPVCLSKGIPTELKYLQINLSEATKICPCVKCPYPLMIGYTDVFIKRDFLAVGKELNTAPNNNAVPLVTNEQQDVNQSQSALNTPSSSVKTQNTFEELNSWCDANFPLSDQGVSSNEKVDDLSHMDVPYFSNEDLMDLLNFEDNTNTPGEADPSIDCEIDRLLENLTSDTNDMGLLDNSSSDLNLGIPVNRVETDRNSIKIGRTYDTSGVVRESHKNMKDNSLLNVGESNVNTSKSRYGNACESGSLSFELGISKDKNLTKSYSSQKQMNNVNNRLPVQIVKSSDLPNSLIPHLGNIKEKSQLIVIKYNEKMNPPKLNDVNESILPVTFIDKQNSQKVTYPNSSYKTLISHQQPVLKQQILKLPCKNNQKLLNTTNTIKKNTFEGLSIKQEVKGKNDVVSDRKSVTDVTQNVTVTKNEIKKEFGKGNDTQNVGNESSTGKGKFEGFSFNEALKSIDKPNSYLRRRNRKMRTQQS